MICKVVGKSFVLFISLCFTLAFADETLFQTYQDAGRQAMNSQEYSRAASYFDEAIKSIESGSAGSRFLRPNRINMATSREWKAKALLEQANQLDQLAAQPMLSSALAEADMALKEKKYLHGAYHNDVAKLHVLRGDILCMLALMSAAAADAQKYYQGSDDALNLAFRIYDTNVRGKSKESQQAEYFGLAEALHIRAKSQANRGSQDLALPAYKKAWDLYHTEGAKPAAAGQTKIDIQTTKEYKAFLLDYQSADPDLDTAKEIQDELDSSTKKQDDAQKKDSATKK